MKSHPIKKSITKAELARKVGLDTVRELTEQVKIACTDSDFKIKYSVYRRYKKKLPLRYCVLIYNELHG